MKKNIAPLLFTAVFLANLPMITFQIMSVLPISWQYVQNSQGTYDRRAWLKAISPAVLLGITEEGALADFGDWLAPPAQAQTITSSVLAPVRPSSTVATLPTCNAAAQGQMYIVTDALTPVALATVAGGGAVKVPVICNGTNWIVG